MRKSKKKSTPGTTRYSSHNEITVITLRLKYRFFVLLGVLVLAGIAIMLENESPSVWTFLYGLGGWAALTTHQIPKIN